MSNVVTDTLLSLVKSPGDAKQVIVAAKSSVEGAIILEALHEKVLSRVDSLIDGFIDIRYKENPDISDDEMVDGVVGDLWHYERRKLGLFGFVVDVLRNDPKYNDPVRSLVRTRAETDESPDAAPTGPTPTKGESLDFLPGVQNVAQAAGAHLQISGNDRQI